MFGIEVLGKRINRIVIDSRSAHEGDLFVAYKGEKADGNDFVQSALDNGASAAIAERYDGDGPVLVVDDVQKTVEGIISDFRSKLTIPIIGITGSVGKTTTKEMISCVLSEKYNVLKTEGNFNNTIGVPLTMSRIDEDTEIAVVEMGINHFGEMTHLAEMVRPTIMVYTTIGHAHLEFLNDLDGVFKAKTEVLDVCSPLIISNGNDPYLSKLPGIHYFSEPICTPPAYGRHILSAMGAAVAVGRSLGMSDEEIVRGIGKFKVVGRRGAIHKGYVTLIDDSYNANIDSMKLAIDSMSDIPGNRKVCVFGGILEQGDATDDMQREIGRYARENGCIVYQHNADYGGEAYSIDKLQKDDVVLVKASLGSHLDKLADQIKMLDRPCVFLDVDDTVLDWVKTEESALKKAFKDYGIEIGEDIIKRYAEVNLSWWERLERGEVTRDEVMVGRFNDILDEFGLNIAGEEIQDIYENHLCEGHFYMTGAENLLEKIYGKYRLFLSSNGSYKVQKARLDSSGCLHYFENHFISEEIGAEKPNPEFLRRAVKTIVNFNPDKSVIVGDSLTSDVLEGKNFGIKTVWFNCRNRKGRDDIVPDYEISDLSLLPGLLEEIFKDR